MQPTQVTSSRVKDTVLLVVLTAILSFCFLGSRPFSTRGEPREALVAQAMFESGSYLLGSGYGGVVPSKPPFMHWFITAFSQLTGEVTEFTSRAPSALASFSFLLGWFFFLRRRIPPQQALFATLLLATSIEWFRTASTTRVDMTLAALLGVSVMGLFGWWERKLVGVPFGTILALCGATLTKGPVAIALPGVVFGLFLLIKGERLGRVIGKCLLVFIPALFGALLWYFAAYLDRGPEFFEKVYYENFARLTSTQEDRPHDNPALYLLATIPLGLMPWTLLALPFVWRGITALRQLGSLRIAWASARERFQSAAPLAQFSFIAAVVFIVFFSIPSGKRSVYLLPIYPFLALGLAEVLSRLRYHESWGVRAMIKVVSGLIAVVLMALAAIFTWSSSGLSSLKQVLRGGQVGDLQQIGSKVGAEGVSLQAIMLLFFLGLLLYGALCTKRITQRPHTIGLFFALLFLAANGSVIVLLSQQTTPKTFAPMVAGLVPEQASLYSYGNEFYGLSFYLKREIRSLEKNTAPELGSYVVMYAGNVADLSAALSPGTTLVPRGASPNSVDKPGQPLLLFEVSASPSANN